VRVLTATATSSWIFVDHRADQPTQGHIPAALPYLAHAAAEMRAGEMQRAMFVAKGSLFLGKMTNLADGMSFLVEAPR
jgi:hypothetical protein